MDNIYLLLENINALKSTLEALNFAAYFDPTTLTQQVGFSEMELRVTAITDLSNTLATPPPTA